MRRVSLFLLMIVGVSFFSCKKSSGNLAGNQTNQAGSAKKKGLGLTDNQISFLAKMGVMRNTEEQKAAFKQLSDTDQDNLANQFAQKAYPSSLQPQVKDCLTQQNGIPVASAGGGPQGSSADTMSPTFVLAPSVNCLTSDSEQTSFLSDPTQIESQIAQLQSSVTELQQKVNELLAKLQGAGGASAGAIANGNGDGPATPNLLDQYRVDQAKLAGCKVQQKNGNKGCGPKNLGYDGCECSQTKDPTHQMPDQYAIDQAMLASCTLQQKNGNKGCGPMNLGYDGCACQSSNLSSTPLPQSD